MVSESLERHDVHGAFGGIHAGQFLDLLLREVANVRSPLDGVFGNALLDNLVDRFHGETLHLERSFDGGLLRGIGGRRCAGSLVPHRNRIDHGGLARARIHRTLGGRRAQIAHVKVRAVLLHQERRHRAASHELFVHQAVLDNMIGHGQHERAVGARPDGNVDVGVHGRRGELRVDGDELCALLARIAHELPRMHVRLCRIAAPRDNGFGVGGIHEVVARNPQQRRLLMLLRRIGTGSQYRAPNGRDEATVGNGHVACHRTVQNAVRTIRGPNGNRRATVIFDSRAHLLRDGANSLVPADALPLARSALPDALHGVLEPVGIVHALRLAEPLHAEALADGILAGHIHGTGFDHLALAHRHLQGAAATAVAAACAPERLLAISG